jgi:hypothetical protein
VAQNASSDRYDPLPGFTEIPAWLLRKLSPKGRRIAAIVAAVAAVGLAVALYFAIPAITDSKQERAAAERRADAQREAALVAKLRAEQRLREGRGTPAQGLQGAAAITARKQLAADLSAAVHADADARVQAGEFKHAVGRVECERFPRGARGEDPATDLANPVGRYSCLAITADAPQLETNNASSIGYPYRARVDFPSGKYTFCKISGRPGEGSLTRKSPVRVPSACGGDL